MRRRSRQTTDAPGQDSFLDIVANLVGILIILVMVIGVRARDALVEAAVAGNLKGVETKPPVDLETPGLAVGPIEADVYAIQIKIDAVRRETATRYLYRSKLYTLKTAVTHQLNQRHRQLDTAQAEAFALHRSLDDAGGELRDLTRMRQAIENQTAPPVVIEHQPTPLAKTVFGKEVHFRLLGGRLAYVPLNELVQKLKGEWQQKLWRLKDSPEVTETIGPIRGFRIKYTIAMGHIGVKTRIGTTQRNVAHVSGFNLIPVSDDLGSPFQEALAAGSEFRSILADLDPQRTTITVWTYPDSFNEFRILKQELRTLDFLTAGRPLPAGHSIGGSPSGSRSAAQ